MIGRRGVLAAAGSGLAVLLPTALPAAPATQPAGAAVRVRPVRFDNQRATLAGSFHLPPGEPAGGVVLVHGSGRRTRMDWLARVFAERGLAVLAYDKRGVGESSGTFERLNDTVPANLALLAGDAAAAMRLLRDQPELAGRKVGYWGISQAGWVIPLASSSGAPGDFLVLWSGPVCTVTEELEAGIEGGDNLTDPATLRRYVDDLRANRLDTDPRDALRTIKTPGLWIYGGKDQAQVIRLSIDRLQGLIDAGQANFAYWLNSSAGHDDFAANQPFLHASAQWMLERCGRSPSETGVR